MSPQRPDDSRWWESLPLWVQDIPWVARSLWCRIAGHDWKEDREWAGDTSYIVGWICRRCYKSEGA